MRKFNRYKVNVQEHILWDFFISLNSATELFAKYFPIQIFGMKDLSFLEKIFILL